MRFEVLRGHVRYWTNTPGSMHADVDLHVTVLMRTVDPTQTTFASVVRLAIFPNQMTRVDALRIATKMTCVGQASTCRKSVLRKAGSHIESQDFIPALPVGVRKGPLGIAVALGGDKVRIAAPTLVGWPGLVEITAERLQQQRHIGTLLHPAFPNCFEQLT